MKNYFKFNLTGQKLLPYWLLMLLLIAGLALSVWLKMDDLDQKDPSAYLFIISAVIVFYVFMFAIVFFMYKLSIENIEYKDQTLMFGGKLGQFLEYSYLVFFLALSHLEFIYPGLSKKC